MLDITPKPTESGDIHVYDPDEYLIGTIHQSSSPPECLRPAVITPAGEAHSLFPAQTQYAALVEIHIAARQYTYLPHQIRVSASINPWTGERRYRVACPTCIEGGLPATPSYASGHEAALAVETDHHQATGQHAVLTEEPEALHRPGPPTNSPYRR